MLTGSLWQLAPSDLTVEKALTLVGLPVLGGVITHLWGRYRHRLAIFRWSAEYQPMAFATHDFGWGKIDILYNDVATKNLHIATVRVENTSSRDFDHLTFGLRVNDGSVVLRSAGQLTGETTGFRFTEEYDAIIKEASKRQLTPNELAFWGPRADFVVPVLNRSAVAEFRMLISRSDYATPSVTVSCTHVGVRVVKEPPEEKTFGVARGRAQFTGMLVTLVMVFVILKLHVAIWVAITLAWLAGALVLLIGASTIRAFRRLMKLAE